MSFITNLILLRLKEHLTETMQTNIDVADLTRANIVKIGRFQENPVTAKVYIAISGGLLEQPDLVDGIAALGEIEKIGMKVPPREIGGGEMWWRRGSVRVGCFYVQDRLDEETAAEYAYEVLGRLQESIDSCYVGDLSDSYGETAIGLYCYASSYIESGGPPEQYIWRGTVKWMLLTERP